MKACLRALFVSVSVVTWLLMPGDSFASPQADAEAAASDFLQQFDSQLSPTSIYDSRMSAAFKASAPKQKFTETLGMLRIQLGGAAASRQLMGSQQLSQIQGVNSTGPFFYFRYVGMYPVGKFAQDVTLEKEDSKWKVVGFYFLMVP